MQVPHGNPVPPGAGKGIHPTVPPGVGKGLHGHIGNVSSPFGHSLWTELAVELVGVGIATVIANASPKAGKIMVAMMVGFLIVAIMMHLSELQKLVGKA